MSHKESFSIDGLMCGTCLVEVLERLHHVEGVVDVGIDLHTGGRSPVTVRGHDPVAREALVAAVTDAGFRMTNHSFRTSPTGRSPQVRRDHRDRTATDDMPIGGSWR